MPKIPCAKCRHDKVDKAWGTSPSGKWDAIVCGNEKSPYFKDLLNTNAAGEALSFIAWPGCDKGEGRA